MGVKGLISLLRQHSPQAFTAATAADIAGRRIGIDAAISLCKGAAMSYKQGPLSALEILAQEVTWLLEQGCKITYVFDGKSPPEKLEEDNRRRQQRQLAASRLATAVARLDAAPDDVEARELVGKLERQHFVMTDETRRDAKLLLVGMGIGYVEAPGEAEQHLAQLQRAAVIDVIFTEDIDVLLCGATSFIKNYSLLRGAAPVLPAEEATAGFAAPAASERPVAMATVAARASRVVEIVTLEGALAGLDLGYDSFVTVGLLSGCDFAPKLPGMGPATALKHVKAHGPLLSACEALVTAGLLERYERARALLSFDAAAQICTGPVPETCWNAGLLEMLFAALQQQGSVGALKWYVSRAASQRERACGARCEAEPAAKRLCLS